MFKDKVCVVTGGALGIGRCLTREISKAGAKIAFIDKNEQAGKENERALKEQVMRVSRITLILVSLVGMVIALDENSVIFTIVSFAWAGFGATFGPLMLFSLFWKRTTRQGAIAGMLTGGIMVFVWNYAVKPLGGIFGVYELLPAFILSSIAIVIVSLLTEEPSKEVQKEFDLAKNYRD